MKRPIFIVVGVVIVFILLAVWIYMLFFGSPENGEGMFANFGFGDTTDSTYVEPDPTDEDAPVVDILSETSPLQQLTTQPVAGYHEIDTGSSTPNYILYSEIGTGHIFSIDLETGEEERVSATTIPSNQEVSFTPNGEFILARSGSGVTANHQVGRIDRENGSASLVEIDERIESFSATIDNRFMYAVPNDSSLTIREYDPVNNLRSTIFTVPFREAAIVWGDTVSGPHYIYPKASGLLEGYLYRVVNGSLQRLPIDGFGLSSASNDSYVVFGKQTNQQYQTFLYDLSSGNTRQMARPFIPEKCTLGNVNNTLILCGVTDGDYNLSMPDQWYAGEFLSADSLFLIDAERPANANLISNTKAESGRDIDIINMQFHANEEGVFFQNRIDQTLWTYNEIF